MSSSTALRLRLLCLLALAAAAGCVDPGGLVPKAKDTPPPDPFDESGA